MCLITTDKRCRIAEQDIKCYKVLVNTNCNETAYYTPYQFARIEIGQTYKSFLDKPKFSLLKLFTRVSYIKNGLHSFSNLTEAMIWITKFTSLDNHVIAECTIPKGSKYYEGTFKYGFKYGKYVSVYKASSFASTSIIYDSLVK